MEIFLPQKDELSINIQQNAADLLKRLKALPVETLGLPYHCLEYFKSSHFKRLFFSIETSAHLLYRSISLTGKPVNQIVIMDYGAGVGTLYMLAKMIGCRTVIYNDHLEDWKTSALLIAQAIGVNIDQYIVGDIKDTLLVLDNNAIACDIITSRNVIEHIYKLDDFFNIIADHQPGSIVYSSTTANYHNPASHLKHILWHRKWEKHFLPQRAALIRDRISGLPENEVLKLAKATRGLALQDFDKAVVNYSTSKTLPDPSLHNTNTVETSSGVWFEHLLPFESYRKLIPGSRYQLLFEPGFWDTHNQSALKNALGNLLNPLMRFVSKGSIRLAPFIYVIAIPKNRRNDLPQANSSPKYG
jgi:2-polyprenyl-3-methyl-5-hydroxy-6-metoxy-1,4-benzoquinol methylase